MQDFIFIENLMLDVLIGAYPQERKKKQTIIANIHIYIDSTTCVKTDQVDDTVNSHHWTMQMIKDIADTNYHLLESLAQHIAEHLQQYSKQALGCKITLSKPNIIEQASSCGVCLHKNFTSS